MLRADRRPVAGLLTDLKRRGLLDQTLVIWGGEFGRTPGAQGKDGRDHHPYGFSVWLAGGGIKGGQTYGATDDFGYRAVDRPHQRGRPACDGPPPARSRSPELAFPHNGRDERLTDVFEPRVLKPLLA